MHRRTLGQSMDDAIISGNLGIKRSESVLQRYFVLYPTFLAYFSSDDDVGVRPARGILNLDDIDCVEATGEDEFRVGLGGSKSKITLTVLNGSADLQNWLMEIQVAMKLSGENQHRQSYKGLLHPDGAHSVELQDRTFVQETGWLNLNSSSGASLTRYFALVQDRLLCFDSEESFVAGNAAEDSLELDEVETAVFETKAFYLMFGNVHVGFKSDAKDGVEKWLGHLELVLHPLLGEQLLDKRQTKADEATWDGDMSLCTPVSTRSTADEASSNASSVVPAEKMFKLCDASGSGFVTFEDVTRTCLASPMVSNFFSMTPSDLDNVLLDVSTTPLSSFFNCSKNNKLSLEEFRRIVHMLACPVHEGKFLLTGQGYAKIHNISFYVDRCDYFDKEGDVRDVETRVGYFRVCDFSNLSSTDKGCSFQVNNKKWNIRILPGGSQAWTLWDPHLLDQAQRCSFKKRSREEQRSPDFSYRCPGNTGAIAQKRDRHVALVGARGMCVRATGTGKSNVVSKERDLVTSIVQPERKQPSKPLQSKTASDVVGVKKGTVNAKVASRYV